MFNKSGLIKSSKLQRDDVMKIMNNKTKSDNAWNQLITKAVDACFNECKLTSIFSHRMLIKYFKLYFVHLVSHEDIEEIAQHIKTEVGKNMQSVPHKICHPASSIMLDCIYRELYKVCPKEKFSTDISECSILQNYTKTCDDW